MTLESCVLTSGDFWLVHRKAEASAWSNLRNLGMLMLSSLEGGSHRFVFWEGSACWAFVLGYVRAESCQQCWLLLSIAMALSLGILPALQMWHPRVPGTFLLGGDQGFPQDVPQLGFKKQFYFFGGSFPAGTGSGLDEIPFSLSTTGAMQRTECLVLLPPPFFSFFWRASVYTVHLFHLCGACSAAGSGL